MNGDVSDALRAGSTFLREQYFAQQPRYDQAAFVDRVQGRTEKIVSLQPLLARDDDPPGAAPDDLGGFGHFAVERMVRNMLADLRERLVVADAAGRLGEGAAGVSAALGALVGLREGIEDAVVAAAAQPGSPAVEDLVALQLAEGAPARVDQLTVAVAAYASAVGASADTVTRCVTAVEIVTQALAPQVRSAPPPFALLRLGPDNVSPLAPSAVGLGDLKLYGTRLGHFGAFGKQEWRAWDWAWGRLDAAAQLGRALGLGPDAVLALQQGIWAVEGGDRNLEDATAEMRHAPRVSFGRRAADGLLESTSRLLRAETDDLPAFLEVVARQVGAVLRTRWTLNPLWLVPGVLVRRKIRQLLG